MSHRWRRVVKGSGSTRALAAKASSAPSLYLRSEYTQRVYQVQLSEALLKGTDAKVFSHYGALPLDVVPANLAVSDMVGGVWAIDTVNSWTSTGLYDCRLGPFKGTGDSRVTKDTSWLGGGPGEYPFWYPQYARNISDFKGIYEVVTEQVYTLNFDDFVSYGTDILRILLMDLDVQIAQNPKRIMTGSTRAYKWDVQLADGSFAYYFDFYLAQCDSLPAKYIYREGGFGQGYLKAEALYDPACFHRFEIRVNDGINTNPIRWGYGSGSYRPYIEGVSGFASYGMPSFYILHFNLGGNFISWMTPSEDNPSNLVSGQWPFYQRVLKDADAAGFLIEGGGSDSYVYRFPSWASYGR